MPHTLGNSGPAGTSLGLGLAALGRPGYITLGRAGDMGPDRSVQALEHRAHEVLDAAYHAGVRYFDAARSYGRAEDFLASWLASRGIKPGEVVVGSKWGYTYTADWNVDAERHEVKDHSVSTLRRQYAESRARLGAHLGLYQIHSATFESGVLDDALVLKELARLRENGLRVGLSLSGPQQAAVLRRALDIRVDGRPLFSCVQATWNVLERSVGSALAEAHASGWGVILKEVVANGRLGPRDEHPALHPFRALAAEQKTAPDVLAMAAALAQPWASIVLSGAATVAQLNSHLHALTLPYDEALDTCLRGMAEAPQVYWTTRSALPWN
uniref:MxcA n=1 Tax=Stigmatella aurantiaca TaxID=41 RepID=Q9F642_STIAU|nr:MxcA [Stigmatella aurantiaca Sg a15]